MMWRRRWRRVGIGAGILALAWPLFVRLDTWRARAELQLAQRDIAASRLDAAHRRLAGLAARPGALEGAADYWLGVCEALAGRPDAALRAFARVPEAYPFEPLGAYLEAKIHLSRGRLYDAEQRLKRALAGGGPGRDQALELLSHLYEIEVRFDDVKALHHASLAEAQDPTRDLRELSNLDLSRVPYDGLKGALEKAGQLAPQDVRVQLGKARLAIQAGRWDEAALWLRLCREARADAPLWRAWLEWARGSGQPAEALEAARQLGPGPLEPGERLELRAWLEQQRGETGAESTALESWLQIEPTATRALERLAELAHRAGRHDRVAEFRRRKAEVERAMEAYRDRLWSDEPLRTAADRAGLGRMAEAAGHPREAHALFAWALKADPGEPSAREGLARLDRAKAREQDALSAEAEAWTDLAAPPLPRHAESRLGAGGELTFTDDAEAVGLRFVYENGETPLRQLPEPFGGGLALLDYDGDGWLDVYCVQGGPFSPVSDPGSSSHGGGDRLFHNRGDGTFEDATDRSGIARFPRGHGHGIAVGDVDGDGRPDVFITRWRSYALYRNRGDGTFEDVTDAWGLGGRRDWPTSVAMADLDGDGDLDLYVCHYAAWDYNNPRICRDPKTQAYLNCSPLLAEALPDRLFRNDGGRFVDVTASSGIVDRNGRGLGVVAADLDGDGRLDLFVANDSSANFLFRNLGAMRFEETAHAAGVAGNATGIYQAGMGVAAGDLDGDGLIDLAVTNFYGESTTYYRNLGGGAFLDGTGSSGLAVASRRLLGFGIAFLDANDDGRLDLATANGHVNDLRPNYPYFMPAQLLVGGPDGRLTDVSDLAGAPWRVPRMGRGLAVGDLDNDGRQDVLILSHAQPLAYFHNRTEGGRSLTLRLEGRGPNRDAVGARVTVVTPGRRLLAWRTGGGSYQSASDPRLHFGLGGFPRAESIAVLWPSGRAESFGAVNSGSAYILREGTGRPELERGPGGESSRSASPPGG
jgi:hypothetical protein